MSSNSPNRELGVPRLTGEALEWVETALALNWSHASVAQAFVETFPDYIAAATLSEEEVLKILSTRFKKMRCDTQRHSYSRIQANQAKLNDLLDDVPIASPLLRLVALEQMRQNPNLNVNQRIKLLNAARKEVESLNPRQR